MIIMIVNHYDSEDGCASNTQVSLTSYILQTHVLIFDAVLKVRIWSRNLQAFARIFKSFLQYYLLMPLPASSTPNAVTSLDSIFLDWGWDSITLQPSSEMQILNRYTNVLVNSKPSMNIKAIQVKKCLEFRDNSVI